MSFAREFAGRLCALTVFACAAATQAHAQGSYEILHAFASPSDGPTTTIAGFDNTLYGTTANGGPAGAGTVFKLTADGTYTVLHAFDAIEQGRYPLAPLAQAANGSLYGTTWSGGALDAGTVFKITPEGAFIPLHSFNYADGYQPMLVMTPSADGALYGVSEFAGQGGGAIFRIGADDRVTIVHAFDWASGAMPRAPMLRGADGALYGVAASGGAYGGGTVFRFDGGTGEYHVLHAFSGNDGREPETPLVQAPNGVFYGVTPFGGQANLGTIFRISSGGEFATTYAFQPNDGARPRQPLAAATDGSWYGVTTEGGVEGRGTLFRLAPDGLFSVLHAFTASDGTPSAMLVESTSGAMYGLTANVGGYVLDGFGTVFKHHTSTGFTTVHRFARGEGANPQRPLIRTSDGRLVGTGSTGVVFAVDGESFSVLSTLRDDRGALPNGPLLTGADGALYGITQRGGTVGAGAVFKVDAAGVVSVLHSFTYDDGAEPIGGLIVGPDGAMYGATLSGGRADRGTLFRITFAGVFSMLHAFAGPDGANPVGMLTLGPDQHIYGTVANGAAFGSGGIVRVPTAGPATLLRSFTVEEGRPHLGGLTVGLDGALYGVNSWGNSSGLGQIYRITPAGAFAIVNTFTGSDGAYPYLPPVVGPDGALYGTTALGGASYGGTVYRLSPEGVLRVLHDFTSLESEWVNAALSVGPDSRLYGTALRNAPSGGRGTVFALSPDGTFTLVHEFNGADGSWPLPGLTLGPDGRWFGATLRGGAFDNGTLFEITTDGALRSRHSFGPKQGDSINTPLVVRDGAVYGTAAYGGPAGGGVVFRLTPSPDTTAPHVVAEATTAPNTNGWYTGDVIVHFTCTDEDGFGIPDGACPADQILSGEGAAVTSTAVTVTDAAGNVSLPSNVVTARIDRTAPALAAATSDRVLLNGVPPAIGVSDNLSGVVSSSCEPLDTATVGTRGITCTATDAAGNVATAGRAYRIVYGFDGFMQPINDPASPSCSVCVLSVFKNGTTIAVKLQLKDASGALVQSAVAPQWMTPVMVGTTSAPVNEGVEKSTPSAGSSYRWSGQQYIYNWAPKGAPVGSTWRVGVRLDDGETYTVDVAVR